MKWNKSVGLSMVYKNIRSCFIILIYSLFPIITESQVAFQQKPIYQSFFSGIVTGSCDINGDCIDDLLVLDNAKRLWLGLNSGDASFSWEKLPFSSLQSIWSVSVADIDRNSWSDIVIGGFDGQIIILYQDRSGFTKEIIPDSKFFSQAATLYDIDRDGWIDFTICDDNDQNRIYKNNAAGKLIRATQLVDFDQINPLGREGNYGCTWADYDVDGDPDLYISKCSSEANDPADPRRINLFFVKDTNGWKEKGVELGVGIGDQSWVSAFNDLNGDALPDLVVLNHYSPSKIFIQQADHSYLDFTVSSGWQLSGIPIQLHLADFDNDKDVDIIVSGSVSECWINDGKAHFTRQDNFPNQITSCTISDFNEDGFLDLYTSGNELINEPSQNNDRLFIQNPNSNHFVKFTLKGDSSNTNGIGSQIFVYLGSEVLHRELKSGESYGLQNSLNVHFGLGRHSTIDSVKIIWPSGKTQKYYLLTSNLKYIIEENNCIHTPYVIPNIGTLLFCYSTIDTILTFNFPFNNLIWNDGQTGNTLRIQKEGMYYFTAEDSNSCKVVSHPISVFQENRERIKLLTTWPLWICEQESIVLQSREQEILQWSTGEISNAIIVDIAGSYFATSETECGIKFSDTIQIFKASSLPDVTATVDTIFSGGMAKCVANLDSVRWYDSHTSEQALYVGRNFVSPSLQQNRSYWYSTFSRQYFPGVFGGLVQPEFNHSPYEDVNSQGVLFFDVYKNCVLDSVTVYADIEGERIIELVDSFSVRSITINVQAGKNRIPLHWDCSPLLSPYILRTNSAQNIRSLGTISPQLKRSNSGVEFPYFIEDMIRIKSTNRGDSVYFYFYDWRVTREDKICESARKELKVVVVPDFVADHALENLSIHRMGNTIYISSKDGSRFRTQIFTLDGKRVYLQQEPKPSFAFESPLEDIFLLFRLEFDGKNLVNFPIFFY